jgi:cytochrome c553
VTDNTDIPTIAWVGAFFLENQMAIFSESARPCAADAFAENDAEDHCAIISALSEDDKMALAEHFGEMSFESFAQDVDAGLAEQGASIHSASCDRCHTSSGAEPFDDAGMLAGQPIPYLISQLKHYKAGERWQPESMAEEMEKLDEGQMQALANFYASEAP